eukprot:tig00020629_g12400.t1
MGSNASCYTGSALDLIVAVENGKTSGHWCGLSVVPPGRPLPPGYPLPLECAEVRVEGRVEGYDPSSGDLSVLLEVAPEGRFGPVSLRLEGTPSLWRPGVGGSLYSLRASTPSDSLSVPLGFPGHSVPLRGSPLSAGGVPLFVRAYHDDLTAPGGGPLPPGYPHLAARIAALSELGFDLSVPSSYPSALVPPAYLDVANERGVLVSAVAPRPAPAARQPCLLRGKLSSGVQGTSVVPDPGAPRHLQGGPTPRPHPAALRAPDRAAALSLPPEEAAAAALCWSRDLLRVLVKEEAAAARLEAGPECRGLLINIAECLKFDYFCGPPTAAVPDRLDAHATLRPALGPLTVLREHFPRSLRRGQSGPTPALLLDAAAPHGYDLTGARLCWELSAGPKQLAEGSFDVPAELGAYPPAQLGEVPPSALAAVLKAASADRPHVLSLSARLVDEEGRTLAENAWRSIMYPSTADVLRGTRLAVTGSGPEGAAAVALLPQCGPLSPKA